MITQQQAIDKAHHDYKSTYQPNMDSIYDVQNPTATFDTTTNK